MENIFVEFLPPWIETGRQPAFYDKESGSVLQQTARMYARVNMLIRMFNKLSKQTKQTVEEYIDKFNELHDYVMDYFANLDVQEEINNKLDDMVEQGTLQEIIADYLNSKALFGYDTVADMKSATNLIAGSYAKTLGFITKGDEGGATYKIRDLEGAETADNMTLISLHDTLVAELQVEPIMTTRQFGSGTNADTDVLLKALSVCDTVILSDNFTIPPQQINITTNKVIDFNGHKITMGDNNNISWANLIRVTGSGEVVLKNGEIDGNSEGQTVAVVTNNTGVLVTAGTCTIDSMKIHNCHYEGIITNGKCNLTVTNSSIYECGRNGVALLSWENVVFENDTFWGVVTGENICDIDIEPYDSDCNLGRVKVSNCLFKDNLKKHNFQAYLNAVQTMPAEILMENCKCFGQVAVGYDQGRLSSYTFNNITISGVDDKPALYLYETKQNVTFKGTFINCAYPIKVEEEYTWDYIANINIDGQVKGTAPTKGIEFIEPEGVMEYPHPMENFNIKITGTNSIIGWKLLNNSVIKTNPLEVDTDLTLNENTFYSDIYMTGWAHYIDIDSYYNKSKHVNPSFTIHTNNVNTIRCTKLPALNANVGNGGINMNNNDCSLGLTLHNHNGDKFIVDNLTGIYTARTIS